MIYVPFLFHGLYFMWTTQSFKLRSTIILIYYYNMIHFYKKYDFLMSLVLQKMILYFQTYF